MKKKNMNKRLSLNKDTIANLEMNEAKGGALTDGCQTFRITNCESWEFPICECQGFTLPACP